jgi:hypothetical protein
MRLKLDADSMASPDWAWEMEEMPGRRNGVDCVKLPNNLVLLVNGASHGMISGGYGGGGNAGEPVQEAW